MSRRRSTSTGINIAQTGVHVGILINSDCNVQQVFGYFMNYQQHIQVAILTMYHDKTPRFTLNHWEIPQKQLLLMTLLCNKQQLLSHSATRQLVIKSGLQNVILN